MRIFLGLSYAKNILKWLVQRVGDLPLFVHQSLWTSSGYSFPFSPHVRKTFIPYSFRIDLLVRCGRCLIWFTVSTIQLCLWNSSGKKVMNFKPHIHKAFINNTTKKKTFGDKLKQIQNKNDAWRSARMCVVVYFSDRAAGCRCERRVRPFRCDAQLIDYIHLWRNSQNAGFVVVVDIYINTPTGYNTRASSPHINHHGVAHDPTLAQRTRQRLYFTGSNVYTR